MSDFTCSRSRFIRIVPLDGDAAVAGEAARRALDAARDSSRSSHSLAVALSGGRIAPRFYAEWVARAARDGLAAVPIDFFWADERCVPPDHPDANFAVANASLLLPLGTPAERVHRLAGEIEPVAAARRATQDWIDWQARRPASRAALDLVILGVGEDGHVASLFPENLSTDLAATDPFRAVTGSKPPPQRLTMGYPLLWEARQVLVLATGTGKEPIVRGSLDATLDTPLARVLRGREERGNETTILAGFPLGRAQM